LKSWIISFSGQMEIIEKNWSTYFLAFLMAVTGLLM
jgi:hypothetical protein